MKNAPPRKNVETVDRLSCFKRFVFEPMIRMGDIQPYLSQIEHDGLADPIRSVGHQSR
jgi:hypothetical protein